MDTLIVGLLIAVFVGQIVVLAALGAVAYLCYKTLVRPEAPCYAASMASMMPRMGMVEVDPSHPSYNALSKMLAKKAGDKPEVVADKSGGQYL